MSIDVMKQALEVLEAIHRTGDTQAFDLCYADKVIPSLRAAIEQSEQRWVKSYAGGKPNYTEPEEQTRQWQGLTDDEIAEVRHLYDGTAGWTIERFARQIEAKLKEKNT